MDFREFQKQYNDETKTRLIEEILQESKSVYKRTNSR